MPNADAIREHALVLAASGADREQAIHELERWAAGRRVAVVGARQQMATPLPEANEDSGTARAIEWLDEVLVRLPA